VRIPSLILASLILAIVSLNRQNLHVLYLSISQICSGGKIFYLFTKAKCATSFCPGVVSEWSGCFLFSSNSEAESRV
jgi:hypothetical protein